MTEPRELWIGRDDERLGPHAFDRFRALHREGRLQADDLVWWDGLAEWIPLDAALVQLGLGAATAPTASAPPPLPAAPAAGADYSRADASSPRSDERAAVVRKEGASPSVLIGFVGLVMVAVLAAAAFAFLRAPASFSFGKASREVREALSSAAMYKVAYAEYVLSNDKVPRSLEEIGVASASYGSLQNVHIDSGTLLFQTSAGQLALQPYRNANYQIIFRCGRAAPPTGMDALGQIDSAQATTIPSSDLPDDCR